jgi:predicted nuclease of predicted toxin-antitoxin system
MRFLANENIPGDAVSGLTAAGHDIVWVRSAAPGIDDANILAWAARERRVLLTFDQDFGELAWRARLPATCGIVLFRLPMPTAAEIAAVLVARLAERDDWTGHFSVIQPGRIRMRPIPALE